MTHPSRHDRRRCVPRPLLLGLLLWFGALAGCHQELPPPEEFYRGQAIPFGPSEIAVYQVRKGRLGDSRLLSVYLRIDPRDSLDKEWVPYLANLELIDASGQRYRALGSIPVAAERARDRIMSGDADDAVREVQAYSRKVQEMYQSEHLPREWNKWNVTFQVPEDARPLSLYLENPEPRDGQPLAAVVPIVR